MKFFTARVGINFGRRSLLTAFSSICKDANKVKGFIPSVFINRLSYNFQTKNILLKRIQPCNIFSTFEMHNQSQKDSGLVTSEKKGILNCLVQSKVLTVPNVLTVSRILSTPVLGYLVVHELYLPALSLFVFAGFTDLFDGLIARNFKSQTSPLGSFLDPLADKLLVSTLFATLTYVNLIPVYLMGLVISRDVLLLSAGIYIRYTSLNSGCRTLTAFFDPTNYAVKLQPTHSSKFNTAVQLSLVAATLASPVFGYVDHQLLHGLWHLTALTTIVSGVGYIFAKDTIKHIPKTFSKRLP